MNVEDLAIALNNDKCKIYEYLGIIFKTSFEEFCNENSCNN